MKALAKVNPLTFRKILSLVSYFLWLHAHAAVPLWTITPAPGSSPIINVAENESVTVQYIVQNQSAKPHTVVMQPLAGIVSPGACVLAPRGQTGSSCTLNLNILGNTLPQGGIHGGPVLCQANANGNPSSDQCYQPSSSNSLQINPGNPATGASIAITPSTLSFVAGTSAVVTITNSATSTNPANNISATIPGGSSITQQSTCGASLPVGASCTITFSALTAEGPVNISISGNNTNVTYVVVSVTAVPLTTINVTPTSLSLTAGGGEKW